MANNKEVRLVKIPLATFLEALDELYQFGVEYIDIIGVNGKEQDTIGIAYSKEYMNKDLFEKFDEEVDEFLKEQSKIDIKLSDDDLNQLT